MQIQIRATGSDQEENQGEDVVQPPGQRERQRDFSGAEEYGVAERYRQHQVTKEWDECDNCESGWHKKGQDYTDAQSSNEQQGQGGLAKEWTKRFLKRHRRKEPRGPYQSP